MSQANFDRAEFLKENARYNREWFSDVRQRVEDGAPFAVVNVDTPTEIFKAFDIPVIVNQWWSSICGAKQKSAAYLGELNQRGYREGLCSYCSIALGSVLSDDPDKPWGGLPKPTIVVTNNTCGAKRKIFEAWGKAQDIPVFILEHPVIDDPPRAQISEMRTDWERLLGTRQLDFLTDQYRDLIAKLEELTGRKFDQDKFERVMNLVNQQEEYTPKPAT